MLLIHYFLLLFLQILLLCFFLFLLLKIFIAFSYELRVCCVEALSAFTKFLVARAEACAVDSAISFTFLINILLLVEFDQGTLARLVSDVQVLSRILGQFIRRKWVDIVAAPHINLIQSLVSVLLIFHLYCHLIARRGGHLTEL